jgi:ankyrin repeat protein
MRLSASFFFIGHTNVRSTEPLPKKSLFYFLYTPLHYACAGGAVEATEYLLMNGADPNKVASGANDQTSQTPLFLGAWAGEVRILEMLFDSGAVLDSDKAKNTAQSPLSQAVKGRHIDCLEVLLSRGVKPTAAKGEQLSPLMCAITFGLSEGVEQLLARGADPNYTNPAKSCPLWLALRMNRPDIVQLLLDKGAKVDFRGPGGANAVHVVCQTGNLELLKKVIEHGADPRAKDDRQRTATFTTLMADPKSIIPMLAYLVDEVKLDLNAKDERGSTLLLEVLSDSQRMTPEIAQFLLSRKVDVNATAGNGKKAFEIAMQCCSPAVKAVFTQWANKRPGK